jgi:hypothetical protein
MKNQINILNIAGAAISASFIVFLYFFPSLNLLSLIKSRSIAKTQKTQTQQLPNLRRYKKALPPTLADTCISSSIETKKEETEPIKQPEPTEQTTIPETQEPNVPQQIAEVKTQEPNPPQEITEIETQELECIKVEDTPQQLFSKSNGCPKNLDYYTKKPRPKQTPEECITCKNLINCVCLTSN